MTIRAREIRKSNDGIQFSLTVRTRVRSVSIAVEASTSAALWRI